MYTGIIRVDRKSSLFTIEMNTPSAAPNAWKTDEKLVFDAQLLADGSSIHEIDGLCSLYRNLNKALNRTPLGTNKHQRFVDLSRKTEASLRTFVRERRTIRARFLFGKELESKALGTF